MDHNYSYIDYPSIIKKGGYNGFEKSKSKSDGEDKKKTEPKKGGKKNPVWHIVKKGDTLLQIAAKYETTVAKIVKDNNIKNPDLIYAGQKLKIK